ncbi:MAG TPA: pilus assembly protein N-terminal domain-containing protein [Vicinamibacterales bacterium]|nr:pilus assembly protein N-terminal domain-containing protein [Vicinamibacterales bacterium]
MRKFIFILLIAVTAPHVRADEASAVRLLVGRSTIIDVGTAIQRVSLTSADIADAVVTSANQLLVNGKMPGTISMYVWERSGGLRRYEIIVQRDLAHLNDQMKELFPGETIDAQSSGKGIVLSGLVSSKEVFDKASSVAGGYVDKGDVVNLLRMQEGPASNQVLLQVRFAEVSRSAMSELGANLFTSPTGISNTLARVTTQQFAAPGYDALNYTKSGSSFGSPVTSSDGKFTFSDFLNLFLFSEKYDIGVMIKALQTRGLFQSLAEPNLVAESGKEASFLAGGEFPVPIAQGTAGNVAISVQYKEFGVRLNFTPIVNGNRVHLKVRPEVSTLDFANGVLLQGFRIPALSTRRTETELELVDGQTFAIAGLMNNTVNSTLQKIPGIGDIPILGNLFKSKAAQKNQTELVVMITPHILPRNSNGVTGTLPRTPESFLPAIPTKKLVDPLPPAFPYARPGAAGTSPAAPVATASGAPVATAPVPAVVAGAPVATAPVDGAVVAVPVAPAAPAGAAADASSVVPARSTVSPATVSRPLTADEKKAAERAQKQQKADQERQAKLARAQEKADQERQAQIAKDQAKQAKHDAEEQAKQAKRDADEARKQQK